MESPKKKDRDTNTLVVEQWVVLVLTHESNYAGIVLGVLRGNLVWYRGPKTSSSLLTGKILLHNLFCVFIIKETILCGWFQYCLDDFNTVTILILFRQF